MNSRRYKFHVWSTAAVLALGHSLLGQDAVPGSNLNANSAAPAVALTPVPMSEYVLQTPPPPLAPVGPTIDSNAITPARLSTPTNDVPVAATLVPTTPNAVRTTGPQFRNGPAYPGSGSFTAPTWRWYGWGAASTPGFAQNANTTAPPNATPTLPAPQLMNPTTPSSPPPANSSPPMPPAPELPRVNLPVVPMTEPASEPNWSPAAAPVAAPPIVAPTVDMTPTPKPAPALPTTGPAVDPWTGIAPAGAKSVVEWRTVRASSAK